MTTLTFHMARSIEDHIKNLPTFPNVNIIVSDLCHDANVSPWARLAENLNIEVRSLGFNHDSCTIDLLDFDRKLDERTILVCLGLASNACGTINPVKKMIRYVTNKVSFEILQKSCVQEHLNVKH